MIEYKFEKNEASKSKRFIKNGHTMLEFDVLKDLKRLAQLEENIKNGSLIQNNSTPV